MKCLNRPFHRGEEFNVTNLLFCRSETMQIKLGEKKASMMKLRQLIQLWIEFIGQRFDMIDFVLESIINCVLLVLHLDVQLARGAEILATIKLFVHQ